MATPPGRTAIGRGSTTAVLSGSPSTSIPDGSGCGSDPTSYERGGENTWPLPFASCRGDAVHPTRLVHLGWVTVDGLGRISGASGAPSTTLPYVGTEFEGPPLLKDPSTAEPVYDEWSHPDSAQFYLPSTIAQTTFDAAVGGPSASAVCITNNHGTYGNQAPVWFVWTL